MNNQYKTCIELVPPLKESISFNQDSLRRQLIHHEGLMCGLYLPRNNQFFIGVGRNLSRDGVSEKEASYLISRDVRRANSLLDVEGKLSSPKCQLVEGDLALSLAALISDHHIGVHLFDNGITQQEAHYLLDNDIKRIDFELSMAWSPFSSLPFHHQAVLINMAFDIGVNKVLRTRDLLAALAEGAAHFAAIELEVSDWAKTDRNRAKELIAQLRLPG
ncbi:hypothetical protein [uncultured Shewanella sp.]|uniref:hypothetical protein n=1 Tax=uncultured Shewanella sp. TaxID=173975 RepID=UPI00260C2A91|nr:hypothetical protein [uncultured Shewanella sp.]